MNSISAIDYWIAVLQGTVLERLPFINCHWSHLTKAWLGGARITSVEAQNSLVQLLPTFSQLKYLVVETDDLCPWTIAQFPRGLTRLELIGSVNPTETKNLSGFPPNLEYLRLAFEHTEDECFTAREEFPVTLHTLMVQGYLLTLGPCPPCLRELYISQSFYRQTIKASYFTPTLELLDVDNGIEIVVDVALPPRLEILVAPECDISSWTELPTSLRVLYFCMLRDTEYVPNFADLPRNLEFFHCNCYTLRQTQLGNLPTQLCFFRGHIKHGCCMIRDLSMVTFYATK